MKQHPGESRLHYLCRVAIVFIERHAPDDTIIFDEAECDGSCLADDLRTALDMEPGADVEAPPENQQTDPENPDPESEHCKV